MEFREIFKLLTFGVSIVALAYLSLSLPWKNKWLWKPLYKKMFKKDLPVAAKVFEDNGSLTSYSKKLIALILTALVMIVLNEKYF